MPYPSGKVNNVTALSQLIAHTRIEHAPFERDGNMWAAAPQQWWCDHLGVSVETLRRLIRKPPVVRKRVQIAGKVVTVLRLGTPDPKTEDDYTRILASIWRKHLGRVKPYEFGCLRGLVQHCPHDKAPKVLSLVLDDWPAFMAGCKITMENPKYFKFPSASVILRFSHVALEMMAMHEQGKAVKIPKSHY